MARIAGWLAADHRLENRERLKWAAWVHDSTKEWPQKKQLESLEEWGRPPAADKLARAGITRGDLRRWQSLPGAVLHSVTACPFFLLSLGAPPRLVRDIRPLVEAHTTGVDPDRARIGQKIFMAADYLASIYLRGQWGGAYWSEVRRQIRHKPLSAIILAKFQGNLQFFLTGGRALPAEMVAMYNSWQGAASGEDSSGGKNYD